MRGSRDSFGWSAETHMLASIYDSINVNTLATGHFKKGKAPKFEPYPRPKTKQKKSDKPVSVKDLFSQFKG